MDLTNPVVTAKEDVVPPVSSPEDTMEQKKRYQERLEKDRSKIRDAERIALAKEMGYDTWDAFKHATTESKLLEKGLDPATVKPILKEIMSNDPEYREALEYKKLKQEEEKQTWAKEELKKLNSAYGTAFKTIDELDEGTISLWNAGVALEKAYVAQNFDKVQEHLVKKASIKDDGKQHMKAPGAKQGAETTAELSEAEFKYFQKFNPGKSREEFLAYKNKKEN